MLSFVLSVALVAAASQQPHREPYRLLEIQAPADDAAARELASLGLDHIARNDRGTLELVVNPDELAKLDDARIPYLVLVDDLERWYAARLDSGAKSSGAHGRWLSPPFAQGAMGGYYTYNQVVSVIDQIHAAYPALTTAKASLGTTTEGRTLWMIKISDNPTTDENEPEVRIDAMHHAREPEGMQASLWFVLYLLESYATDPLAKYLVDNRELFYIPIVNPDGYVYNQTTNPGGGGLWRKNRRNNGGGIFGVDLNRNYNNHWGWDNVGSSPFTSDDTYRGPSAASEPEVAAMQSFMAARNFRTALSVHTYSNLWLYPYGYDPVLPANNAQYVEVSNLATEVNNYEVGSPPFILYEANGVTNDYEHDLKGTMSWTPEVGSASDGFWPPTNRIIPIADEMLLAQQRTMLAAGAFVHLLSSAQTEVGDGDGYYEAGESVRWTATARNSGRSASSTAVLLSVTTSSPNATVVNASASLGALGSFAQANNNGNPLEIAILPSTPGGTSIPFTLELSYEGYVQSLPGQIFVGQPRPFVVDDAEVDWGWTKGVIGDTATTGIWVRGVPIGTNSSGTPANPGADTTTAPGVNCYMTGNGGGSAGNDDVDNGATTLISPIFDLSGVDSALVSYSRWFADLTAADDVFAISISNDGGVSWTPLENDTTTGTTWSSATHDVASVLPLTASMRLRFVASDTGTGSVVEAAIDDLRVQTYDDAPRFNLYGRSTAGATVQANITGPAGSYYTLRFTPVDPALVGTGNPPIKQVQNITYATGTIDASGLETVLVTVPAQPYLVGKTYWYRALVHVGSTVVATNWDSFTVQ